MRRPTVLSRMGLEVCAATRLMNVPPVGSPSVRPFTAPAAAAIAVACSPPLSLFAACLLSATIPDVPAVPCYPWETTKTIHLLHGLSLSLSLPPVALSAFSIEYLIQPTSGALLTAQPDVNCWPPLSIPIAQFPNFPSMDSPESN